MRSLIGTVTISPPQPWYHNWDAWLVVAGALLLICGWLFVSLRSTYETWSATRVRPEK